MSMYVEMIDGALVIGVICGVISSSIGNAKRRPRWFWAGFLLGPLGVLWIMGMPPRTQDEAEAAEAERSAEIERIRVIRLQKKAEFSQARAYRRKRIISRMKKAGRFALRDDREERR